MIWNVEDNLGSMLDNPDHPAWDVVTELLLADVLAMLAHDDNPTPLGFDPKPDVWGRLPNPLDRLEN